MFAASMTEAEVNRAGSASDLRFFGTTYGSTFGYNERAKKYHRSYGLVTPPTQAAFQEAPQGALATAPLYRRDHLGFRRDLPDEHASWAASANALSKNQKHYGDSPQQRSPPPQLPVREVQWHGATAANGQQRSAYEPQQQYSQARFAQHEPYESRRGGVSDEQAFGDWRPQDELQPQQQQSPPPAPLPANGRAILTSSLSPARLGTAAPVSRDPWANISRVSSGSRTQAQLQIEADRANPNLYPTPALKHSHYNPQYNVRK